MITFTNRIQIAADPHEVFAYLADPRRLPEWNYYLDQVTPMTAGPPRTGSRYHQQRRTDEQIFEIVVLQPPQQVVLRSLPGHQPAFTRTMSLAPAAETGTELTDAWELDTGHPPLMQHLGRPAIQRGIHANLRKLAQLLETGATTLQDGRVSRLATGSRGQP